MPELGGRTGRSSSRPAWRVYWYIEPLASWNWGGVGRKSGWGKGTCRDFFFLLMNEAYVDHPRAQQRKWSLGRNFPLLTKQPVIKPQCWRLRLDRAHWCFSPCHPASPLYLHFSCEVPNLSWEAGHVTGYLLYTVLEALKGITLIPMLIFDKIHRELARSCLITVRGEDRLPSPLQLLMLTLCFSSA